MKYEKPLPQPNMDTKPFWDGCKKHQLRLQKCRNCRRVRWPPAILCPHCYSLDTEWITASGRGRIYTYTVYHESFHEAFRDDLPYTTAIVGLDEGVYLMSNIVGCSREEIECDMPVEVVWDDESEEFTIPKFRPAHI